VFAIVILSTLGLLYRANHPELVGGDEDPEDGATVAATVFTAVIIYAVSFWPTLSLSSHRGAEEDSVLTVMVVLSGLLSILWPARPVACPRKPARFYCAVIWGPSKLLERKISRRSELS
jgi:hypothetical protein